MMPRFVQLKLRDRLTGADLLTGADFVIRADASAGCAQVGSQGGSQVGSQGGSAACVSSATAKSRRGHDD